MTAAEETMLQAPRERAGRAALGRRDRDRQVTGRHERRVRLIEVEAVEQPVRATRATRSARSRRARAGWVERARRLAGQAQAWWAEGTERVAVRRGSTGGRAPTPAAAVAPGAVVSPVRAVGGRPTPTGGSAGPAGSTGTFTPAGVSAGPAGSTGTFALRRVAEEAGSTATFTPRRVAGPAPRHLSAVGRRASWGEDVVTGWCSVLVVLGLYLDGTAWRGVLYLGLVGTAGWILTREQRPGAWSLRAVPAGYRLALVGAGLAMVAVAGDAVWHRLSGVEQGAARLVSPFHLVLFAGACLLGGSALRAAWSGPSPARVPGLKAFWPVVLSVTLVVAGTAFFFREVSPLAAQAVPADRQLGLLVQNLFFIAPVLLLLLRWQTPLGTFTVMAGSVAVALTTLTGLGLVGLVGAAVLGGTAADVAVAFLRPSPQRRWAARAVAVLTPAVYWIAYFALLKVGYGAGWEPALWLGSVLWACLSGFTLALLMWPPAVPLTAWNRGRTRPSSTTTPTAMPARMVGR